ncbi:MAG: AMP phosphorylase [Nanoarchaeota archaeon]|nr:AMP phosphorylase [Nanoarchaeota archaeon]
MKLKVKDINIATGWPLVAVLNEVDALKLDLHYEDRVKIKKGRKKVIAIINIAESSKIIPMGKIGLYEEVLDKLCVKSGDVVDLSLVEKPASIQYIKKKLKGRKLSYEEFYHIIDDIIKNKLSEIEITYFVSACYTNGLDLDETVSLTKAMINTGEILKLAKYPVMDLHCIGGVAGNRTTMVVVPIVAAAGLTIPKTSSRSITSPAGTADTMEVLSNVSFSIKEIKKIIRKTNACLVWGGSVNLAPADDKIIRIEHPVSLDPEGQLLASILAKKRSASATHLLIDIPIGKGSKIESRKKALHLKRLFESISKKLGIEIKVIITDGSQPVGNGIGPGLEARDVLWVLKNDSKQPLDLREKSLKMAGLLLEMGGKAKKGAGTKKAFDILNSGAAYRKMIEIIKAQGGKKIKADNIKIGKFRYNFRAKRSGVVTHIDNDSISKIARAAGAPLDKGAGIYLHKHVKDSVKKGDKIFTIYAKNKQKLNYAINVLKKTDGIVVK